MIVFWLTLVNLVLAAMAGSLLFKIYLRPSLILQPVYGRLPIGRRPYRRQAPGAGWLRVQGHEDAGDEPDRRLLAHDPPAGAITSQHSANRPPAILARWGGHLHGFSFFFRPRE